MLNFLSTQILISKIERVFFKKFMMKTKTKTKTKTKLKIKIKNKTHMLNFVFILLVFLSPALLYAQSSQAKPSIFELLVVPVFFMVLLYIIFIRPQSKKFAEQKKFEDSLKAGDHALFMGSIHCKINKIFHPWADIDFGGGSFMALVESLKPLKDYTPEQLTAMNKNFSNFHNQKKFKQHKNIEKNQISKNNQKSINSSKDQNSKKSNAISG